MLIAAGAWVRANAITANSATNSTSPTSSSRHCARTASTSAGRRHASPVLHAHSAAVSATISGAPYGTTPKCDTIQAAYASPNSASGRA